MVSSMTSTTSTTSTPSTTVASPLSSLTLLLGGVRSGKSARAVELAHAYARDVQNARVLFVATAQAFDADMASRIAAHRRERPEGWSTLEVPMDVPAEIARTLGDAERAGSAFHVVVIDCITLWTSNLLLAMPENADAERAIADHVDALLAVCRGDSRSTRAHHPHWIVVSNEVGLGVVPPTPLGRRYRDALGRANRLLAAAADRVTLMVAGLEMRLK